MSVAQKLGRSGAGQENYDTETGQYVNTLTYNDVKPQPQEENKDPSRYENPNQEQERIVKPHFKNVLRGEGRGQPQKTDDYAEKLEEFKKQNPNANSMDFLKQTDPEKYEQAMKQSEEMGNLPTENYQQADNFRYRKAISKYAQQRGISFDSVKDMKLNDLKFLGYASDTAKVPLYSMIEAYKNYSVNKNVYGRSAFMKMMKRQIAERDRKDSVNRNSFEYNKHLTGLNQKNADVIKRYNDKYVNVKNQSILEKEGIPQKKKEIISQKAMLTRAINKYNRTNDSSLRGKIKNLQDSIMLGEQEYANMQKRVAKKLIPNVKSIEEINNMFERDPENTTKLLRSIYEDVEREEEEKRKASKLLGVKI